MPRKIIVLEQTAAPSDYRVVFWLDVPAARQFFYANPAATSVVKDATVAELDALKAGAVIEEVGEVEAGGRTGGKTDLQAATALVARYNARQAALNASQLLAKYGTFYDGTAWTVKTVA